MATNVELNYYNGSSYNVLYPKSFTNIDKGSYTGSGEDYFSLSFNNSPIFISILSAYTTQSFFCFTPSLYQGSYYTLFSGINGVSSGASYLGTTLNLGRMSASLSGKKITLGLLYWYNLQITTSGQAYLTKDTNETKWDMMGFPNKTGFTYYYTYLY